MTPQAFFLPASEGRAGQRFCLYHPSKGRDARGAIVYVHPFADEMNKSRRMAALQARRFSEAGFAVLQIDLLGCGDSSGDFGDASWQAWIADVVAGAHRLKRETDAPLWLWGLRAGCLLAVEAASHLPEERIHFLFWQPATSGKLVLQQFLRFKAAGDLTEGRAKIIMEESRRQLASGQPVDVAGYRLSAELASGLERAELHPPANASRVEWIDVTTRAGSELSPSATRSLEKWRQAGVMVHGQSVTGPSFWQTIDVEEAPELLAATQVAMVAAEHQPA
jgi:exosortase A-associated hydrolase 2